MKTYEEMAQSVIRRAKAHKAVRNRWILGSAAAILALGLCLGLMAAGRHNDDITLQKGEVQQSEVPAVTTPKPVQTQPTELPATNSPQVTFLYSNGNEITPLQADVYNPCLMEVRVKDIRGLSEEERNAVCEAEKQYAETLVKAHPDAKGYQWSQFDRKNVVVTSISVGHFIIGMPDPSQIESVHATIQGMVQLTYMNSEDVPIGQPTLEYEDDHIAIQNKYYPPHGGMEVGWRLSNESIASLDQGSITLKDIHDTITFTVTYVDGTIEVHTIDLIFTENGQVHALYQGPTATA